MRWILSEDGYDYDTIEAETASEALEIAESNVERGNYPDADETIWIDVQVYCEETEEEASSTVTLHPEEPECVGGEDHDWQSPYSVLGGCKENPGVWGYQGGVIIKEVCHNCGKYRITDTWAQRSDTGEQGLTSMEYEDADDASKGWIER